MTIQIALKHLYLVCESHINSIEIRDLRYVEDSTHQSDLFIFSLDSASQLIGVNESSLPSSQQNIYRYQHPEFNMLFDRKPE